MRTQTLAIAIVLIASIAQSVPVIGQEFFLAEPVEETLTEDQKKQAAARAKKAEEKKLARRLAMRINEMRKACDLSPAQVRRLQLAAKGAVKSELKGFDARLKRIKRMMNGDGLGIAVLADAEQVEEEQASSDGETETKKPTTVKGSTATDKELVAFVKEIKGMYGPWEMMMMGGSMSVVEKQEFWQTQVRKTLKPEQLKKYEDFIASRRKLQREGSTLQMLVGMDSRLLLTNNQREQMRTLIDAELGKFFEHLPNGQLLSSIENFQHFSSTQTALARLKNKAKTFLTKEQITEFATPETAAWEQFGFLMADEFAVGVEVMAEVPADAGFLGVRLGGADGGVLLQNVTEDQAASKAGLKTGDIVTKFNGVDVTTVNELIEAVGETKPGDKVKVTFLRDEKSSEVEIEMGSRE